MLRFDPCPIASNYGSYADDYTKHGKEGAELIVAQRTEGYFKKVCSVHVVLNL